MLDSVDPFARQSIALALFRMLTSDRYCISTVREALDAAGLHSARLSSPDFQDFAALRLHHCVPFQDMPDGFHAELAGRTLALFQTGRPATPTVLRDLAGVAGVAEPAPRLPILAAA